MFDGYLNLINTEKPPPQTEPCSYDQLQQTQTYDDVLVRIQGLIKDEKEQPFSKKLGSGQLRHNQPSSNFALAQDIEKNHKALKEMIQLIDNRGAARYSDRLRVNGSSQAQRKNQVIERGIEEPRAVDSELTEVREELKRVIELIDHKIQKKQKYRQTSEDIEAIGNRRKQLEINIENRQSFPSKLHGRGYVKNEQDYVRMPKPGTHQLQSKSSLPSKPSTLSGQYLNLKQSFDRLNQTQPHRSLLLQSFVFQHQPESKESPLKNILPNTHLIERKEYLSAPKTFNSQGIHPYAQRPAQLSPRVTFVHSGRPASVLSRNNFFGYAPYSSPQPQDPTILQRQAVVHYPRTVQYSTSPVERNRQLSPPQYLLPSSISPQNPAQARLNSRAQAKLNEDSLKKSAKGKSKFSFRDHLEQLGTSMERQGNFDAGAADNSFKARSQIDFPEPFEQQVSLMANPFDSWYDKSEQQVKIQIRSVLQKDSLQSIPELPEDNTQLTIIQQIGDDSKSLQSNLNKRSLHSLPRESLMMRSGQRGLKKRGIGLYQPTYQSQYYSNH